MEEVILERIGQFTTPSERLGATYVPGEGVFIRLWAPFAAVAHIEWEGAGSALLSRDEAGYFTGLFPERTPGDRYYFRLDDNKDRIADPAARAQPEGVDGPSEVYADDFLWTDADWRGVPFEETVIYEIHTGTFSPSHDFQGVIDDLPRLKSLGVTTLEIMPVSPFSGTRNWGYDGVFPHAVQQSYGGPQGLKRLVDAAHGQGLAVILDVVYNHIGPEGNTLFDCGPYTQDKYQTNWGDALNFDGKGSDHVRRYFLQSAWQWLTEYHLDGLRLDAVQMIFDMSPLPFLEDLVVLKKAAEQKMGRPLVLFAETDMNDSRVLTETGMDAQWADDLHHALHATVTGQDDGYYQDYGGAAQIAKIYRDGVAYDGIISAYRERRHGRSYLGIDRKRLVVGMQNHDQIGNRPFGDRLHQIAGRDKARLAAAAVLLSPFTPFLFMGEEFCASTPFLYFIDHQDPDLRASIVQDRREEWKDFEWSGNIPDPADPATFDKCVLRNKDQDAETQSYYRALISYSKILRRLPLPEVSLHEEAVVALRYGHEQSEYLALLCFKDEAADFPLPAGSWRSLLPPEAEYGGEIKIPPLAAILLQQEK